MTKLLLSFLAGAITSIGVAYYFLVFQVHYFDNPESRELTLAELVVDIDHERFEVRKVILQSMGERPKEAVAHLPKIIEKLSDPSPQVQDAAAGALKRIDTPEAQEALKKYYGF